MIQACFHYLAIIVKSQQWPAPSESVAIYLHKETGFVCYTFSVLIEIEEYIVLCLQNVFKGYTLQHAVR